MGLFNDVVDSAKSLASNIASVTDQAFLGTENTNRSLSEAARKLADTIEVGAQRTYILDGFANKDKTKPNVRNLISETPEMIVLVKKKMFSSLAENFDPDKMDDDELHFLKASKKLFENKCAEISAYERLTKLDNIIKKQGIVNTPIARMIYNVINEIDSQFNDGAILPSSLEIPLGSGGDEIGLNKYSKYLYENKNEIKRLRQVLSLNGFSPTTSWVKDVNFERKGDVGIGTGVIELTLVKNFQCTTTLSFGNGSASLSIEDPYYLMFITESDIERAIYQTSNTGFSLVDALTTELELDIEDDRSTLNKSRLARGASIVTFQTNIRTQIYNVVNVILDRIGLELTAADGSGIDYAKLDDPNIPEVEQFTSEEKQLANRVYDNTFLLIKNRIKNFEDFKGYNKKSNVIRRMMHLNYLGKKIIQPMDIVTVFIDSQKVEDKLLAFEIKSAFDNTIGSNNLGQALGIFGNFFGSSAASTISNTVGNITSSFGTNDVLAMTDQAFSNYGSKEAEKNAIAGFDFPMWLWDALKPNFASEFSGTCVFSGLVEKASETYSEGRYEVNVSCKDNTFYFEQSLINIKPGVNQFNGHLYDPLTPFDFDFDESTGLLPAISDFKLLKGNSDLINSNLLKFQDGQYGGQVMTIDKFKNPDFEPVEGLTKITGTYEEFARRVFDAPDGFTYRWKKGIGSAIINQSGTNDGLIGGQLLTERIANVIAENPFGGQDVVNVLSILICGEPYNFNTFMRSATELGTINVSSNFTPEADFFSGIFRKLKRQNKVWGNFTPFKKLNTDPKLFGQAMGLQLMSFSHSNTIVRKQNERTKLLEKLMRYEGDSFQFDVSTYSINLTSKKKDIIKTKNRDITYPIIKRIIELDTEIKLHEQSIISSINSSQISKSLIVIGNNVFFDDINSLTQKDQDEQYRLKLSQQNDFTKRRLWEVKANRDRNLFIVGSEYDLDYDIQSIAKNLTSNFDYINTSWHTVAGKIKEATEHIGMELFANSQGHIEFRTPKYNRIPSSVLYKMMRAKQDYGIQVYPNFLENMFKNRLETAFAEIEIIEDQIRLHAIALGAKNDDKSIATLLQGALDYTVRNTFIFATEEDGRMNGIRKAVGLTQSDQLPEQESSTSIISLDPETPDIEKNRYVRKLTFAANTFNNFDIVKQNRTLVSAYTKYSNSTNFFDDQQTAAQNIRRRLASKMNVPTDSPMIKTIQQLLPNSKNGKLSPIDVLNIQGKLSSLIIQRHEALITTVNLVKSYDSSQKFNTPNSDIYAKLLMPGLYGKEDIPSFLRDMVENEYEDDYGLGSGKRFILKESDIISMTYEEQSPEYTAIEVTGAEQGGLVGGQGFTIDGNLKLANVWSVNYDLWRMYGFKQSTGTYLPFLNSPELQLAPYALFLLNQQRSKIFRGTVTTYGKEEIQPGEVYYIEDRGLLFYSEQVHHSFTYGGNYTTQIGLSYGRPPGEYIPTPLDAIGKNLYKGHYANIGNFRVSRPGTTGVFKGNSLGVVTFPNYLATGTPASKTNLTPLQQLVDSDNGDNNIRVIDDILAKASILLTSTFPQENRGYNALTVRVYYADQPDQNLWEAASLVIERLINRGIPQSKIVGRLPGSDTLVPAQPMFVKVGSNVGGIRNPSAESINVAKSNKDRGNFSSNVSLKNLGELDLNAQFALLYKIIDVWIETDIVPNQDIINSALNSPDVDSGSIGSSGTNPNQTSKPINYENMREFYRRLNRRLNENFDSLVTIEQV